MELIEIDADTRYECGYVQGSMHYSKGFTTLMYLVKNTRDHPEYLDQIKYILDHHRYDQNRCNTDRWSTLEIAVVNYNTTSTLETVGLLVKYSPKIKDALYIIFFETDNQYELVKLFMDHPNKDELIERFMDVCHDIELGASPEFIRAFEYVLQHIDIDYNKRYKLQ